MSGSVSCVTKPDWQFIGNSRLRGVTPRLRVPYDRQKSRSFTFLLLPLLSLFLSLSFSTIPLRVSLARPIVYTSNASFVDPGKSGISHPLITILFLLAMRPTDTVTRRSHETLLRNGTGICISIVLFLESSGLVDIWISFRRLNLQLFPPAILEIWYCILRQ